MSGGTQTLAELAAEAREEGRWGDAATLYGRLVHETPNDPDNACWYGYALWHAGDLEGAIAEYARAERIEPEWSGVNNCMGTINRESGTRTRRWRNTASRSRNRPTMPTRTQILAKRYGRSDGWARPPRITGAPSRPSPTGPRRRRPCARIGRSGAFRRSEHGDPRRHPDLPRAHGFADDARDRAFASGQARRSRGGRTTGAQGRPDDAEAWSRLAWLRCARRNIPRRPSLRRKPSGASRRRLTRISSWAGSPPTTASAMPQSRTTVAIWNSIRRMPKAPRWAFPISAQQRRPSARRKNT